MSAPDAPAVDETLPETLTVDGHVLQRLARDDRNDGVNTWSCAFGEKTDARITVMVFAPRYPFGSNAPTGRHEWHAWVSYGIFEPRYESVTLVEVRGSSCGAVCADLARRLQLIRVVFAPRKQGRR